MAKRKTPDLFLVVIFVSAWITGSLNAGDTSDLISYTSDTSEYCLTNSFRQSCTHNDVLVINSARFGRMRVNKCVSSMYDHGPCSENVLHQVDKLCSGRHSCDFSVSDSSLVRTKPCPADFSSYLEVSYSCYKVATIPWAWCRSPRPIRLNNHTGYLASTTTEEHGCGSPDNPWVISVLPGQRVNLTLLDFNVMSHNESIGGSSNRFTDNRHGLLGGASVLCTQYAIVEESAAGKSNVICAGDVRERHVYLSTTNEITVQITGSRKNPPNNFLIKYEGVGCTDLKVSSNMYTRREGDKTTVYCNHTGEESVLTCAGKGWEGLIKNCTKAAGITDKDGSKSKIDVGLPPLGFSIIIILGVALVVVVYVAIMIIIVMYLQRRRRRMQADTNGKLSSVPYPCEDLQLDKSGNHQASDEHVPMLSRSAVLLRRGGPDYAITGGGMGDLNEAGSISHLLSGPGSGRETAFNTDVHSIELISGDSCGQPGPQCDCIAAIQPVLSHYATRESMRTYDSPARATQRYVPVGGLKNPCNSGYGELPRVMVQTGLNISAHGENSCGTINTIPRTQASLAASTRNPSLPHSTSPQQPMHPNVGSENLPDPDLVTVTLYSTTNGSKRPNNNSVKTENESNSLREQRASTFAKT